MLQLEETRVDDPYIEEDITSFQEHNNDKDGLQRLYDQLYVTPDRQLLKSLLFELGTATMTFRDRWRDPNRHDFLEIILMYAGEPGNVSFGIKRFDAEHTQNTVFFPLIFRGLATFFTGRVIFYFVFQALFGAAVTYEYLGGYPTYPSLTRNSPNARINIRLQDMVRYSLLKHRAASLMQVIGTFSLQTSVAAYAHSVFMPCLFNAVRGGTEFVNTRELIDAWMRLRFPETLYVRQNSRLELQSYFPPNMPIERPIDRRFAIFLGYQAWEYFDLQLTNSK